jgi:hypothetical protein
LTKHLEKASDVMTSVQLGIHVYEDPERLHATVDSVHQHTPDSVRVLLLPDGLDDQTKAALTRLTDMPQSSTDDARGTAAVFNRLATTSADVVILLESGCIVT